jgi:NAD(P)-dependent dehydrogenase (short-subunit alcohol dehydrogenase family)
MALNPRIEDWSGRIVWLVGASTGIGRATAQALHRGGARVVVSARKREALDAFVAQHPGSEAIALDVTDRAAVAAAAAAIVERHGGIDLVMYCAGTYAAMRATAFDLDVALQHVRVNYDGALFLLDAVLPVFKAQSGNGGGGARGGHISLVSSVAGYRGLPQSLAYGPTKAALIHLAENLYLDLSPLGLGVSVINPGFVDTPLTAGNDFKMPALITPEQAARDILEGWRAGRFEIHFPKRFTSWLKLLRLLPYGLYFAVVRRSTGL